MKNDLERERKPLIGQRTEQKSIINSNFKDIKTSIFGVFTSTFLQIIIINKLSQNLAMAYYIIVLLLVIIFTILCKINKDKYNSYHVFSFSFMFAIWISKFY
jgi:hypothetical protein